MDWLGYQNDNWLVIIIDVSEKKFETFLHFESNLAAQFFIILY